MGLRLSLLFVFVACGAVTWADDAPITAKLIQQRQQAAEKSTTLDEPAKAAVADLYRRASAEVEKAAQESAKAERFSQMTRTAPEDLGQARREMSLLAGVSASPPDAGESLDRLQERSTDRETELAARKAELARLGAEPRRRASRRRDIPTRRATVRKQLDEIQRQLDAQPAPGEPAELMLARRTLLQSKAEALRETIRAGVNELEAYQATIDLLPHQRDLASARVALLQREVGLLHAALKRRRESEVDAHLRQATEDAAALSDSDMFTPHAQANLKLVHRRKELRQRIDHIAQELASVRRVADDLHRQRSRVEDKVDAVGLTGPVGLMLRKQKAQLPEVNVHRRAVRQRQPELMAAQLAALELEDRRTDLADLDAALGRAASQIAAAAGRRPTESELEQLRTLLTAERRFTDYLITTSAAYVDQLLELDQAERQLIARTGLFSQYIDERVLWVRNAETLSTGDLPVAIDAVRHFFLIDRWRQVGPALAADVQSRLTLYGLIFTAVVLARAVGWWMKKQRSGQRPQAERTGRLERLLREIVEIVLCAAPLPLLMWFVGQRLTGLPSDAGFVRSVGMGLASLAMSLLPLVMLFRICRPRGFARRHLGWPDDGAWRLRALLAALLLVALPLTFVHATLDAQDNVRWQDSLGRICFMVNVLFVGFLVERLLRPHAGVLYRTVKPSPDGVLMRLRWPGYLGGVAAHVGLAVMALVGYSYAADRLGQLVRATALLLLGLLLVGSLLMRWIQLNTRRLAIRREAERRAAQAAAKSPVEQAAESDLPQTDKGYVWFVESEKPESKMRPLVTTLLATVALIGLWTIWVDVVPALTGVTNFKLWDTEVAATSQVSGGGAGGQPAASTDREVPKFVPVTLGDVLLAALILLATFLAARYIAGLFELPVLDRLPLDSALRNTVTTVTRYVLWIVAVIVAAGFVGIRWEKVQWMAAALSLGLGFGLQEIFANFISGLILLFERPMRVGDVITIGDTTGVVQSIRMRATTITDWDRKELVVPNKEFATGRLLNWTLTNKTNRRVIEVAVAYGTDPDLVRDLLLKVARHSPRVLDTPKPIALFEKFGDSALLFSLRVYHAKISDRLQGLHELNTAIQRELTAAGIKFAFPQRDLHLRTPPPISWFGPAEEDRSPDDAADASSATMEKRTGPV